MLQCVLCHSQADTCWHRWQTRHYNMALPALQRAARLLRVRYMTTAEAEEYVARAVLPAMGIAGRRFTVAPPPVQGTRSSLHLVRADGMPPLLMRARHDVAGGNMTLTRIPRTVLREKPAPPSPPRL